MERPDHISYSQIDTGKCLLKYKHMYLDKDIRYENKAMELGKLVDEIITEYSQSCIQQKLDGDAELLEEILDRKFDESGLDLEHFKETRQSAINFGEKGFNYNKMLDFQKHFKLSIGKDSHGKDVIVEGKIDRIDCYDTVDGPCIEIIDYKNHLNILTEADVNKHEQLCVYDYINCNHLHKEGFNMHRKGIYFVRYAFMRWSGLPVSMGDSYDEFDNTERWIIKNWERLQYAEEFPFERGELCYKYGGCPVMLEGKCPAWSPEEVENFRTGHTIEDKTRLCRRLDHQRKQALDELKALLPEEEMVEVDNTKVGYIATKSYKYDLKTLIKWGEKKEIDFTDIKATKTDIEKIIKKEIGIKTELLPEEDLIPLEKCRIESIGKRFVY